LEAVSRHGLVAALVGRLKVHGDVAGRRQMQGHVTNLATFVVHVQV